MDFPAIDDIQRIFAQISTLDPSAVDLALSRSRKEPPADERDKLADRLEEVFRDYFRERLWQLWAAKAPAGKGARELEKIANAADKLVRLLDLGNGVDAMPWFWRSILEREAEAHAERVGGFPGFTPLEVPSVWVADRVIAARKSYQGASKLRECVDDLLLLQALLHSGVAYEKKKLTPQSNRNRRDADEAMPKLFDSLNWIWTDTFGAKPGTSWNAHASTADGPYVRFLLSLFNTLHDAIPHAVRKEYPNLEKGLPRTADAIRARIRTADGSASTKQIVGARAKRAHH